MIALAINLCVRVLQNIRDGAESKGPMKARDYNGCKICALRIVPPTLELFVWENYS